MSDYEGVLARIADAIERQVAQNDEQMDRNRRLREENVDRHERERAEELRIARATNDDLMAQIAAVLDVNKKVLASWQAHEAAQAVAKQGEAVTRDVPEGGSRQIESK